MDNKDKKNKIVTGVLVILAAALLFGTGMSVGAATEAVPGSSDDPLVSLSYLEQEISENTVYKRIQVSKGTKLYVAEGGEIVIFSGSFEITGNSGLMNVTEGTLEKSGETMKRYNLYIVPVSTCGVSAQASGVVYVKGDYRTE